MACLNDEQIEQIKKMAAPRRDPLIPRPFYACMFNKDGTPNRTVLNFIWPNLDVRTRSLWDVLDAGKIKILIDLPCEPSSVVHELVAFVKKILSGELSLHGKKYTIRSKDPGGFMDMIYEKELLRPGACVSCIDRNKIRCVGTKSIRNEASWLKWVNDSTKTAKK